MNNGKVRIYELSKELNLDNKDLLAICEDLNIAVKSHSSTISETEAASIRSAAAKLPNNRGKSPRPTIGERPATSGGDRPVRKPTEPKSQILQIKHREGKEVSQNLSPQPPQQAPTPPQLKQPSAAPMPPTPNRPVVRPQPPKATDAAAESRTNEQKPRERIAKQPPAPQAPKPQLSGPPARPKPPETVRPNAGVSTPTPKPQQASKPIPKSQQPKGEGGGKSSGGGNRPVGQGGNRRPGAKEAEPLPQLNRPQARIVQIKPQAKIDDLDDIDALEVDKGDIAVEPPLELKLKRPTPPRQPVKKAKTWGKEEEEEETPKAKAPAKNKRRTIAIEDDDDEFDLIDEDRETSVVVSLSIARPPKPKSATATAKPPAAPAAKRKPVKAGDQQKTDRGSKREQKATVEKPEIITLTGSVSVRDLAELLVVPETEIVKQLFFKGMAISVTQVLDVETATMVAEELGVIVDKQEEQAPATKVTEMLDAADLDLLQRRPPVVTIMGHVDHGKTTLLDAIRETKVAQGEAGGITQHIGAYHVDVEHNGKMQQVVFLDTPGHEAFTAMRARGARVTDIAILVVAADDGVRPQTIEAIRHAQAAEVPIVVAINKMDKPEAQPDRVQQELTEFGLLSEEWGGDTIMVPVSALKGENLDTLLEMILLVSEVEDLHANPDRPARGTVIEAHLDKAKGPVATLLVQNGTLHVGDTLVAGHVFGKVRAMVDDRLARVEAASPSFAVEVLGLSDVPAAGDEFEVFVEKEARAIADARSVDRRQSRLQEMMASRRVTLNSLSAQAQEGELKELNLILKADVQGSVEAILGSLKQLPQNEVQIRVLLAAAGEITETDVDLAAASGAVIIGFNTTLASGARNASDEAGVDIREYNIIYALLSDIQGAMEGLLEPEMVEEPLGQVEVRAVFQAGRGNIAGCYVLSGKAIRNCNIRVTRKGQLVYEGILDSLKRMKDDVKEVNSGFECGIRLDRFNDWQEGDIIETFQMVSKRRTLSPA
jgi:translation initiation factor IF-2